MKVILIEDVPGTGRKFETKDVANGYGRNFLLARRLAVLATPEAERRFASSRAATETARLLATDLLKKNVKSLEGRALTLTRSANDQGHLFAGVKADDIAQALAEEYRIVVPAALIDLPHPLKTLGEHEIKVSGSLLKINIMRS